MGGGVGGGGGGGGGGEQTYQKQSLVSGLVSWGGNGEM